MNFASTVLIESFHGLLCLNQAVHSMFQDDQELSTFPNFPQTQNVDFSLETNQNQPLIQKMRKQMSKRDPNYVAWISVSNNMDVLREHLKEKLFVEVQRRNGGLQNIGKK